MYTRSVGTYNKVMNVAFLDRASLYIYFISRSIVDLALVPSWLAQQFLDRTSVLLPSTEDIICDIEGYSCDDSEWEKSNRQFTERQTTHHSI